MLRFLPLILRNASRNRRRSLLTVASIAVSMCLLGVMVAMFHALYLSNATPEQALRLVTRNRVSLALTIPESYEAGIKQIPGVRQVMIVSWFGGTYIDAKHVFTRLIVDPEKLFDVYSELRIPEDQRRAFIRDRTSCVIGRDLVNKYNLHVGERLHLVGDYYPGDYDLTIAGIFDSPRNSEVMYFSREYLEQSLPERRRAKVGTFVMVIDSPDSSARIAQAIDGQFRNSSFETRTETEQAWQLGFVALLGNVKMFLIAISSASMFTILLVSANTMAMSVRDRVREVGVLKTLGFTPAAILGMILGEACALSLAGGAIGFVLSTILTEGVARSPAGSLLPNVPAFQPVVAMACLSISVAIGILSSLVPAMSASRMPIVHALRATD